MAIKTCYNDGNGKKGKPKKTSEEIARKDRTEYGCCIVERYIREVDMTVMALNKNLASFKDDVKAQLDAIKTETNRLLTTAESYIEDVEDYIGELQDNRDTFAADMGIPGI